jgi:hypothetical protein
MGHIVVTARQLAPASAAIADLGAVTVTARGENAFARKGTPTPKSALYRHRGCRRRLDVRFFWLNCD